MILESKTERLGETRVMNCGMKATIIRYQSQLDIDVQFEDGKTRYNVRYDHFKSGDIGHPDMLRKDQHEKRLGETRTMKSGLQATIIAYRSVHDIDVKFETGEIRKNVRYEHFKRETLQTVKPFRGNDGKSRIGETRTMNCGLKATVIAYRRSNDIDVQFETGEIRSNTCYSHFVNGKIKPVKTVICDQSRVGEAKKMVNGHMATIVAYRSSDDIDVQFDNGVIREGIRYDHFQGGKVGLEPMIKCDTSRIGESNMMSNGLTATIIAYRKADDIDIQFEDGVIIKSTRYSHFQNGGIAHPEVKSNASTSIQEFAVTYYMRNFGFRKIERSELKDRGLGGFELDLYNEQLNVAIEVDGGWHAKDNPAEREARKNKVCEELGIKLYRLRDPSLEQELSYSTNFVLNKNKTVSIGLIDCKEELETILTDNGIEFDSEFINFERDRESILREYYEKHRDKYRQERLGQSNYSNPAKQNMTIIEYRAYTDLDVQFEDGSIRQHVRYQEFKSGSVDHPNETKEAIAASRLNEQRKMNNGLIATVIAYRNHRDIDVMFEDGTVRYNVGYAAFKNGGLLKEPRQQPTIGKHRIGEQRTMNCGLLATIIEYKNSCNIDVQFENGEVRRGATYECFQKGKIALPKTK